MLIIRLPSRVPLTTPRRLLFFLTIVAASAVLLAIPLAVALTVAVSMSLCTLFIAFRASAAGDAEADVFILRRCFFIVETGSVAAARWRIEDCLCDGRGKRVVVGE